MGKIQKMMKKFPPDYIIFLSKRMN